MAGRPPVSFTDRRQAGRALAVLLEHLRDRHVVVLGLPRGGVPVAYEVAEALDARLDVIVVRKLGLPSQPELAMGAVGEDGYEVLDPSLIVRAGLTEQQVHQVRVRERAELDARVRRLRSGRGRLDLTGKVAVIVDDGIATGATARVACRVARHLGAVRVVLAAPVGPAGAAHDVVEADEVVLARRPDPFLAVGHHYRDFSATTEEEVVALLRARAQPRAAGPGAAAT